MSSKKPWNLIFYATITLFRILLSYWFDLKFVIIVGGTNSIYAKFDLSAVALSDIHGQLKAKNQFSAIFTSFNTGEEKYENEINHENKDDIGRKTRQGTDERKEGNSMKGINLK